MLHSTARNAIDIFALMKCYAVLFGTYLATFRDNPWVPSSRAQAVLDYMTIEYGTDMLSRNVSP